MFVNCNKFGQDFASVHSSTPVVTNPNVFGRSSTPVVTNPNTSVRASTPVATNRTIDPFNLSKDKSTGESNFKSDVIGGDSYDDHNFNDTFPVNSNDSNKIEDIIDDQNSHGSSNIRDDSSFNFNTSSHKSSIIIDNNSSDISVQGESSNDSSSNDDVGDESRGEQSSMWEHDQVISHEQVISRVISHQNSSLDTDRISSGFDPSLLINDNIDNTIHEESPLLNATLSTIQECTEDSCFTEDRICNPVNISLMSIPKNLSYGSISKSYSFNNSVCRDSESMVISSPTKLGFELDNPVRKRRASLDL